MISGSYRYPTLVVDLGFPFTFLAPTGTREVCSFSWLAYLVVQLVPKILRFVTLVFPYHRAFGLCLSAFFTLRGTAQKSIC